MKHTKHGVSRLLGGMNKLSTQTKVLIGVCLLVVLSYVFMFVVSKPVAYAYGANECVKQLTLAPGVMKQAAPSGYHVAFKDLIVIGNTPVAALKTCFVATTPPVPGKSVVQVSPYGAWLGVSHYQITVPDAPTARASDLIGKTLPLTRPLSVDLSSNDEVFSYSIAVADKSSECARKSEALSCDLQTLGLEQGKEYTAQLDRYFGKDKIATLAKGQIKTLQSLVLANATISEGQVVYDKPAAFTFEYDKDLVSAAVELKTKNGETLESVATHTDLNNKQLVITPDTPLKRDAQFELDLNKVEAKDGSSLAAPSKIGFHVSGGPKVTDVSADPVGTGQNEHITVTFDQPIDASVDLTKIARVVGADAIVRRQSDTQVTFTLQSAPLCGAVTLVIDKGIKSGSNGEVSAAEWKFASRIICGYSATIGYSVKGRPIIAYYFGAGATKLLFTGGIHGSEASGYRTMQAWVTYLQSNAYNIPADKQVIVVPNTNPDGIAAGSRNNANNVNIDRNFPSANWSSSIDTASGTLEHGGGVSPGSEPEAQALLKISRQLQPRLEISFHSQGRLVGANKYGDSVAIGNIYSGTVGYDTMYNNAEAVMGYAITGEYEDWLGEELGVPAILIELPTASGNYLTSQMKALMKMLAI